ncbi:MAG: DRTGG domain-containing protein [Bacteroidales bacterium]
MNIEEIKNKLGAELLYGEQHLKHQLEYCFASDLMSDVLTLETEDPLLITGLTNPQCLRTAEMADLRCIIFARNKPINKEIINLARELDITILRSKFSVFKISGILYQSGMKPIF